MSGGVKVLVTGAGGPAAVAFMKALPRTDYDLFAGDIDPYAVGLYLVPHANRILLPRGDDPAFVPFVLDACKKLGINVLVPTVDSELTKCAVARPDFAAIGVKLLLAEEATLRMCVDKLQLLRACDGVVPLPRYAVFDSAFSADGWEFPLLVKPRAGAGGRGIEKYDTRAQLDAAPRGEELLIQEYLPGAEYSVDTIADAQGCVLAAVPRSRLKVDSGIAVAGRTFHDPLLIEYATKVAERIGLTHVANIQFRYSRTGVPALLEVNARFPGTMSLTVEAGINMPLLSLRAVLGFPSPENLSFRDMAMVRYWEESYPDLAEFAAIEARGAARTKPAT